MKPDDGHGPFFQCFVVVVGVGLSACRYFDCRAIHQDTQPIALICPYIRNSDFPFCLSRVSIEVGFILLTSLSNYRALCGCSWHFLISQTCWFSQVSFFCLEYPVFAEFMISFCTSARFWCHYFDNRSSSIILDIWYQHCNYYFS